MTDTITSLIEKLEGAETGSRELDWLIADATGHPSFAWKIEGIWPPFMERSQSDKDVPTYTTSLDAALALAERVLPKLTRIEIKTYAQGEFHHCTIETDDDEFDVNNCRTPALDLCAAILRAQSEAR